MNTPKRWILSLVFTVLCFKKSLLIRIKEPVELLFKSEEYFMQKCLTSSSLQWLTKWVNKLCSYLFYFILLLLFFLLNALNK